ncbi:unnamed protein product [Polarella glacialis]|uniref:Cyclic nucleotide-binding domain-containing protein n=1 Tax=Polarella glacialis TaxID=89957 RepID=A0A813GTS2_POLGL|nr:unnamed protein product [Polarella glacialis]
MDQGDRSALSAVPNSEIERNRPATASTAPVVLQSSSDQLLHEPDAPHSPMERSTILSRRSSRITNSQSAEQLQGCISEKSDAQGSNNKKVGLMTPAPKDDAHGTVIVQLVWQQDRASARRALGSRRSSLGSGLERIRSAPTVNLDIKVASEKTEKRRCWTFLDSLVMDPGSNKRVAFEVFGLLLILHDLVWWPAQVFGFASNPFTRAILWLSSAFWACDLIVSFFVGITIIDQGLIEMRVSKIARHYARTWLPVDLSLVLIDWTLDALVLLSHHEVADFGGGISLENAQLLQLLRLLRLFKASGFISALSDRIQSETTRILVRVLELLVFIMLINHLVACSWYAIGINDIEREDTWVKANDLKEKGAVYAYTTALHWSITQFVPASMEVVPVNELERSFTIVVIMSAMVIFSSFISTITYAMNQLRNLNSERNAELVKLRRFFSENRVSASLVSRISSCIHQSTKLTSSRVHGEDISILELLPASLKCDLAEEVYAPTLCAHPLLLTWAEYYPRESKRLFVAARSFSLGTKHELFHAGQVAENLYFLSSGQMVFVRDDQELQHEPPAFVSPGQWLAEPAMWIEWKHVGQSSSTENCELVLLPCDAAARILSRSNASSDAGARRYAQTFAAYFAKQPDRLSDVWTDIDVIEAMVSTAFIKEEREMLRQEAANATIGTTGITFKKRRTVSKEKNLDTILEHHHKTLTALHERVRKYSADGQNRKDVLGIGSSDNGSSDDSVVPAVAAISPVVAQNSPSPLFAIVVPGIASAFRNLTQRSK